MNPELFTASPKNNNGAKRKRIVIGVIITIVAIAGIATAVVLILSLFKTNTSTTPQTTTPPVTGIRANVDERNDFQKNQTAKFGYFDVSINNVTRDYKPTDGLVPIRQEYTFLLINITVKNASTDSRLLSDAELGVLSGEDVLNLSSSVRIDPVFRTGVIDAGQVVTGNLVFEVPPAEKDLKLYYNTQIYNYEEEKLKKIEYTLEF